MLRVLVFEGPKAGRRFELLRLALLGAGDGKGERTSGTIRKEARLQDLLERISVTPKPNGHAGASAVDPEMRVLADGTHRIEVAQEDFDLLTQYAEKAQWAPRAARDAVDLWDWLTAADRLD